MKCCEGSVGAMKTCKTCGQIKTLNEFYRAVENRDGRAGRCRKCAAEVSKRWRDSHKLEVKLYRRANKERDTMYAAEWRACNPERHYERARRWTLANPRKSKAHRLVSQAIRLGKLHRHECVVCRKIYGCHSEAEGHHCDYRDPLQLMWLCPTHHKGWHRTFLTEDVSEENENTEVAA